MCARRPRARFILQWSVVHFLIVRDDARLHRTFRLNGQDHLCFGCSGCGNGFGRRRRGIYERCRFLRACECNRDGCFGSLRECGNSGRSAAGWNRRRHCRTGARSGRRGKWIGQAVELIHSDRDERKQRDGDGNQRECFGNAGAADSLRERGWFLRNVQRRVRRFDL